MRDIEDDQELLDLLIHDGAMQDAIWEPTAFWKPYCDHIRNELSRASLKQFRRNPRLTRGFEKLPPAKKELFDKGARGRIAKILLGVPPLNRIGARYERYLKSLIKDLEQGYEKEIALAYYALQSGRISKDILSHVDDSEVGCPYHCEIGGRKYTLKVLSQVCYLSLLCQMENFNKFRRIIEIGGGYGAFAEVVHKWKGDNIKYFVLVDIPPQIYIATQYLKAVFPGKVLDY